MRQLSPQTDGSASGDNDTGYICTFHSFCVSVLQEDSHAIRFTRDICQKASEDEQRINPLTLAVSGYGTGKSHLAATLAQLLSGGEYMR